MAITVGTDSYVSVIEADEYTTNMGLDALDAANAESLLKRATIAIDRLYGGRFIGRKALTNQPLMWPRSLLSMSRETDDGIYYVVDSDGNARDLTGTPTEIKHATIELAVLLQQDVDPYAQPDPRITSESVEIDVIKSTRSFSGGSGYGTDPLFKITLILRPLLNASGAIKLVR